MLRSHALDLIVLFRGPDEDPLESLQRIVQRRIADCVIISETTPRDPRLAYLQAAGVEYVVFGRSAGMEDYPFVDFDVEAMAAETARLFVRDGHRRLGLVTNAELLNYEDLVLAALADETVRLGLPREALRLIRTERGHMAEADLRRFADGDRTDGASRHAREPRRRPLRRLRRDRPRRRQRRFGRLHLPRRRYPRHRPGALALPGGSRRRRCRARRTPDRAHARQRGAAARRRRWCRCGSRRAPATGARRSGFRG